MGAVMRIIGAALLALAGRASAQGLEDAQIRPPQDRIRSVALILAEPARAAEAEALATRMEKMNALAVIPDAAAVAAARARCGLGASAPGATLAALTRRAAQAHGAGRILPVIVGLGEAGDLALAAAQQGPRGWKGLATLGFAAGALRCATDPGGAKAPVRWNSVDVANRPGGFELPGLRFYEVKPETAETGKSGPPDETTRPSTAETAGDAEGSPTTARTPEAPAARATPAQAADAAPPDPDAPPKALIQAYLALAGMDHAFDLSALTEPLPAELDDYPITLHADPDAPQTGVYAIFLSGDGGWAQFDEQIADRLAAAGVPVVGLSTLRYLWRERPPEEIARDVALLDRHFGPRFGARRPLLLGFSLGANVTPFYAPLLPEEMRARLAGIGLISPETHTGFEIRIGGWLGRTTGGADVTAAITGAAGALQAPVLCLYGAKDRNAACPAATGAQGVAFEGGHHLSQDYDRATRALLDLTARHRPGAHAAPTPR